MCVLEFGASVRAWSSRQVDVSPFAEVKDNGSGGRDDGWFAGYVGLVVCEESMDRKKAARWAISNRKVSR